MKNFKVSPVWDNNPRRPESQAWEARDDELIHIDKARASVPQEQKYAEAVMEYDCLVTQYLGAEDPRQMVKLGDMLGLQSRYLLARRRLLSPTCSEIDPFYDEDFPAGTVYGPHKKIDALIVKQLKEWCKPLNLEYQIILMDLIMERDLKRAKATDDQSNFLICARRIVIMAELIEALLGPDIE
jgi:hypothetical protein